MAISLTGHQSTRTIVLSLLIGSAGTLILGIQPVLLGAMLDSGVIDTRELGWAATAEVLAMALGVLVGSRALRISRARLFVFAAGMLMAGANLGTAIAADAFSAIASRGVAGLSEGALVAVAVMSITYGRFPGRLSAIYVTIGAIPQLLLAYLLPTYIVPAFGQTSVFTFMAAIGAIGAGLALFVQERFAPVSNDDVAPTRIRWTAPVTLAVLATLLASAAVGACWSYVDPVAGELSLSESEVALAITLSLLFQVLSTFVVATVGWRLSYRWVLPTGTVLQAISVFVALNSPDYAGFALALCVFGFMWQGCLPFGTELFVGVDSTRATVPLMLPLNFVGLSLGPLVASFMVGQSAAGAFYLAIAAFVVATGLYLAIFRLEGTAAPRTEFTPRPAPGVCD